MDICLLSVLCVLSGRGLRIGLITRPEESYRVWCVCDGEASILKRPWPHWGLLRHGKKNIFIFLFLDSKLKPIPVAARSKAWVCGRVLAGIVGSNPTGAWIFVSCTLYVLSGRGLCDGPIPRAEESYRLCCVSECDQVKINNLDTCCEQAGRRGKDCETKRTETNVIRMINQREVGRSGHVGRSRENVSAYGVWWWRLNGMILFMWGIQLWWRYVGG
jgi:hypothetical protein